MRIEVHAYNEFPDDTDPDVIALLVEELQSVLVDLTFDAVDVEVTP